jgi:hypothetical protein
MRHYAVAETEKLVRLPDVSGWRDGRSPPQHAPGPEGRCPSPGREAGRNPQTAGRIEANPAAAREFWQSDCFTILFGSRLDRRSSAARMGQPVHVSPVAPYVPPTPR